MDVNVALLIEILFDVEVEEINGLLFRVYDCMEQDCRILSVPLPIEIREYPESNERLFPFRVILERMSVPDEETEKSDFLKEESLE